MVYQTQLNTQDTGHQHFGVALRQRAIAGWDYSLGVDHPTATLTTAATAQPASVAAAAAVVAEGLVAAKGLREKEGCVGRKERIGSLRGDRGTWTYAQCRW